MLSKLIVTAPCAPTSVQVGKRDQRLPAFFMAFVVLIAFAIAPEIAHAEPWDQGAGWLESALQNGFTRTLAVIGCIAVGIACLNGHMAWKFGIAIIASVVLMFGAPTIIDGIIAAVS